MNDLPEGWNQSTLGALCSVKTGKKDVNAGSPTGAYPFFTCAQKIHRIDDFVFEGEAILVAGNGFFNVKYYSGKFDAYQRTYVLQNFAVSGKYLFHYITHKLDEITKDNRGSTINYIRLSDLTEHVVPVAPLGEQKRIVEKLEKLLGKVEVAQERLDKIPAILKRFRQSVLAAACSGKLTADWRNKMGRTQEWSTETVNGACKKIVDCPHSTPKWTESGALCLRTTNFRPNFLDLETVRFVSEETYVERTQRLIPEEDDVLYSREGGILGIACLGPDIKYCLGQRMMLMRTNDDVEPKFLMYWLNSPEILERVRELTGGSAAPHLNIRDIKQFPIPLPQQDEQKEIVRRVEELFKFADQIEERYKKARSYTDKLTQSILAKAFCGELVPQVASSDDHDVRNH